MKKLDPAPRFLIYALARAIRHPRTPITYLYCPDCKVRIPPNEGECPVCHKKRDNSPEERQESPIPWVKTATLFTRVVMPVSMIAPTEQEN
jgi:uncharacterized paraquat-inducible protein A